MTDVIRGGYILQARKLLASGIMQKPALYLKLWTWMLLQATHTEHGNLKRGQLRCSIDDMRQAMAYKIGYRTKRPTEKEIRRAYAFMIDSGMIEVEKITHGMLVSILNYDTYQNPENYQTRCPNKGHSGGHSEGHSAGDENHHKQRPERMPDNSEGHSEGRNDAQTRGTIKTRRVYKNDNKTPADFFASYPGDEKALIENTLQAIAQTRKTGKVSDSIKAQILQRFESFDRQQLLTGCRAYLKKEYHLDGKNEKYLFGIIRNSAAQTPEPAPGFITTGSKALDEAYRKQAQGAA